MNLFKISLNSANSEAYTKSKGRSIIKKLKNIFRSTAAVCLTFCTASRRLRVKSVDKGVLNFLFGFKISSTEPLFQVQQDELVARYKVGAARWMTVATIDGQIALLRLRQKQFLRSGCWACKLRSLSCRFDYLLVKSRHYFKSFIYSVLWVHTLAQFLMNVNN